MKYLVLLMLLVGFGCNGHDLGPYPGNMNDHYECKDIWNAGRKIDVKKCADSFRSPKFKIGQEVNVDDNSYYHPCEGIVIGVGNFIYAEKRNELFYYVNTKCGKIEGFVGRYLESELESK